MYKAIDDLGRALARVNSLYQDGQLDDLIVIAFTRDGEPEISWTARNLSLLEVVGALDVAKSAAKQELGFE